MKTNFTTQINGNPAAVAARSVAEKLQGAGYEAWFVGGGVRDLILQRNPQDFDIATSARPEDIKRIFPRSQMVGARFGVALVQSDGHAIEVATFREEGEYHDKRRPDLVRFSDLKHDALRRDFTVNALYLDPVGLEIVDLTGGMVDIENRTLRTVGNSVDRFREDLLRIARGVRFAANLEFEIEPATWASIRQFAPDILEISMERIRDELVRGFTGGNPRRFLDLLDQSGLLLQIIPEMEDLKGCQQPPEFHPEGDVYSHTSLLLKHLPRDASIELVFAALLHDIGKPATQTFGDRIRFNGHDKVGAAMAERITRRLKMSKRQTETIAHMVRRHMQFINVPQMRKSTLQKFLASPSIDDELELHRADCLASHGDLQTYELAKARLAEFRTQANKQGQLPDPLITGGHLISLGMKPGPEFARILNHIYDAQLEGRITTVDEGLTEARTFHAKSAESSPAE